MNDPNLGRRSNWLLKVLRALVRPFRGSSPGATQLEYLIVVGLVALFAIPAFDRFGRTLQASYEQEAEHFEGRGLPGPYDLMDLVGGLTDPSGLCNLQTGVCAPGSCLCFGAGTLVATEAGDRPIETIVPGDRVWSRDPETGAVAVRTVGKTWVNHRAEVLSVHLNSGLATPEQILATPDHPFWVEGRGWVPARDLAGDVLWSTTANVTATIDASAPRVTTTYNLEVEGFHTYFVGRSRALVHNQAGPGNSCTCPPGIGIVPGGIPSAIPPPGALKCGDAGRFSTLPRPKGQPLERDHVPSTAALLRRLELKIFEKSLTVEQRQEMRRRAPRAWARLVRKVEGVGQAVAIPKDVHRTASQTTGSHKNTQEMQERDAADLPGAARRNIDAIQAELDRRQDPCAAAYRQNTQRILSMTQAEYDAQLLGAYDSLDQEDKDALSEAANEVLGTKGDE
jgi:Flp pilus assembly pilin Flp